MNFYRGLETHLFAMAYLNKILNALFVRVRKTTKKHSKMDLKNPFVLIFLGIILLAASIYLLT
jgi:hypothetical protein